MEEREYLTVGALNKYIKRKFDFDPHLQKVYVKGELSNAKAHGSGHFYFTLKDGNAFVKGVMFRSAFSRVKFKCEDGMQVLLCGKVDLYEAQGNIQFYADEMILDGVGNLHIAFEQLKKTLNAEGLFNPDVKKDLPKYPDVIGIVTSPTGAAIRDMITTIRRRYPIVKIKLYPALVQGDGAGRSVADMIEMANEDGEADVLIVGRGGGSIEDLWAFNEEIVARAIYESTIPIISAVGHETDTTIADYVADVRAATPTAAAELATPNLVEVHNQILNVKTWLNRTMSQKITFERNKLDGIKNSHAFKSPRVLLEKKQMDLDANVEKLQLLSPMKKIERLKERNVELSSRLNVAINRQIGNKRSEFVFNYKILTAIDPLRVLERGFAVASGKDGNVLKSVENVEIDEVIEIKLSDGIVNSKVISKESRVKNEYK